MSSISILGFALPATAQLKIALSTKIFGIGLNTAQRICAKCGISGSTRVQELREPQLLAITKYLSTMKIDKVLKDEINGNIGKKIEIGCYQGLRHKSGFPVNGQRTKTNGINAKKLNRYPRRL
ncbi:hypothetical protein QEN19_004343 [Hanseniaspora menglaensis]